MLDSVTSALSHCPPPSEADLDRDLLDFLQSLTPAQRMRHHESALALVRALREAGGRLHGVDAGSASPTR